MIPEKDLLKLMLDKAAAHLREACELSDFMAKNPEIGMEEYHSSAAIVDLLSKYGIDVEYPFDGFDTAFKGVINPEKKDRMVLLAEYDALRGMGHACGHCASGSASVLAALALNDVKSQLDFGVDIIGTPDEEITGGKCVMAEDGVFDGYDFAIMVHMGGVNTVKVNFLALDGIGFKWKGKASHASSSPEKGKNALNAARLFFDAMDMMRQHVIQEARMHGFIKNGGAAPNVVPELAEVEVNIRAPKREQLNDITEWVKDCARAAALATRTELEIFPVGMPYHEIYISPIGKKTMEACYDELGIDYIESDDIMRGSSDIGNVDYRCPAFHPVISIGDGLATHTQPFADQMLKPEAHEAIQKSAAVMLAMAAKLYGNRDLLEEVKEVHRRYRGL